MQLAAAKKVHYDAGPNMTPMVDIVMVILVFFMLGASFIGAEHFLKADMLASGSTMPAAMPTLVRIDVAPAGDTFEWKVNREARGQGAQQLQALLVELADGLKANGMIDNVQVVICPAAETKYEDLVRVYQAVNLAGFQKIAMGQ